MLKVNGKLFSTVAIKSMINTFSRKHLKAKCHHLSCHLINGQQFEEFLEIFQVNTVIIIIITIIIVITIIINLFFVDVEIVALPIN